MTDQLRLNVIYDETVCLQAGNFTTPANSALTFRDFVPRLELLTLFRDFRRSMKMCEMNYFSLFCKSYLVLFFTFIIGTPILCCTTTYLGIFWYCYRDFWSFICEREPCQPRTTMPELNQRWNCGKSWLLAKSAQTKIGCVKSFAVKFF